MSRRAVIVFQVKGDLKKTDTFLRKMLRRDSKAILRKYGKLGVEALAANTPKDTGRTSESWSYDIEKDGHDFRLVWANSNINEGVPIAILIQYGHGTRGGTFVQGRDYINPALRAIFDNLADELWKEVTDA